VVDLNSPRSSWAALEQDRLTGVRVAERPSDDHTLGAGLVDDLGEISAEDVVARVATVVVGVLPRGTELSRW
jgi:hypothetical protein